MLGLTNLDLLHGPWLFENKKTSMSLLSVHFSSIDMSCSMSTRASGISFTGFNVENDHSTEAVDTGISATKPLFHYGLKEYSNSCWQPTFLWV